MDPTVNSHIQPCGHFTGCTKIFNNKQQTEGGGRTDKHGFRTANAGKWSWRFFSILCIFIAIARTLRKSYTATKNADSSESLLWSLTPNRPPWSLNLNWHPSSFFRSHRFSRAQVCVWFSHQYRQRKVFWTLQRCFKDAGDNICSLITHPWTQRDPHIFIHIYIYIYTLMLVIVPHHYLVKRQSLSKVAKQLIWTDCILLENKYPLCVMGSN